MRGVNKVIIVENLGQDPDTKYMPSGDAVTNISVATSESWKDKQTGEKKERTEWHRVVFFKRLAEVAAEYLRKGSQVYIEGKLRTQKWEKDGQTHYKTEIVAHEMQMLGGRGDGNQGAKRPSDNAPSKPGPDDFDDDIPFAFVLPTLLGLTLAAQEIASVASVI